MFLKKLVVLIPIISVVIARPGYLHIEPAAVSHQSRVDVIKSSPVVVEKVPLIKEILPSVEEVHISPEISEIHDLAAPEVLVYAPEVHAVEIPEIHETISHHNIHQVHENPIVHHEIHHGALETKAHGLINTISHDEDDVILAPEFAHSISEDHLELGGLIVDEIHKAPIISHEIIEPIAHSIISEDDDDSLESGTSFENDEVHHEILTPVHDYLGSSLLLEEVHDVPDVHIIEKVHRK